MFLYRLRTMLELVLGLRRHDFRAARTFMASFYPGQGVMSRTVSFARWAMKLMWRQIPETASWASFANPVSRTPIWLRDKDPFENHPFAADPSARLPDQVEVVVIGAGMAGSAACW